MYGNLLYYSIVIGDRAAARGGRAGDPSSAGGPVRRFEALRAIIKLYKYHS